MLDDIANAASGSISTTTQEGMGQRLLNSIVGVLIGIVFFFGSFVLLWWNEGNVIEEKNALNEMSSALVEASADKVDKKFDNKLVHATAKMDLDGKVGDPGYLKPGSYLLLERHAEMYQWIEKAETHTTTRVGGTRTTTTTYSYLMGWSEKYQDSSTFHNPSGHTNPQPTIASKTYKASKSHFGKLDGASVLDRIAVRQDLPVKDSLLEKPKDKKAKKPEISNGFLYLRKTAGSSDTVGDQRISYKVVAPGTFSVIAKQVSSKKYVPYVTSNGREKFLVEQGKRAKNQMIQDEKDAASSFAWVMRFVGFIVMFVGLNLLAGPIVTLLDVIPFLGTASRFLLGVVFFLASLVLTTAWVIFAMIAHHPVVLLLTVAAAGGGYYYYREQKKKGATGLADMFGRRSKDQRGAAPKPKVASAKAKPGANDRDLGDSAVIVEDTQFESSPPDVGGHAA